MLSAHIMLERAMADLTVRDIRKTIRRDDAFAAGVVSSTPGLLHGVPVFPGTRVPVRILHNWLQNGMPLSEFLHNYPGVTREMAEDVLEFAFERTIGARDDSDHLR